ncbi:ferredoxin [Streptomyces sp. NPDC001890]|uniref:ferredoxin n=1 Tax=Streptomyces sp. NPDC001890 TaxID=3364620 RepID=UPI00367A91F0
MNESLPTLRVAVDRTLCLGAGQCAFSAPDVFDQDDDGLVTVLDPAPSAEHLTALYQAEDLCPSGALRVIEAAPDHAP